MAKTRTVAKTRAPEGREVGDRLTVGPNTAAERPRMAADPESACGVVNHRTNNLFRTELRNRDDIVARNPV